MQASRTYFTPQDMNQHITSMSRDKESDESDVIPMIPSFSSPPPSEDEGHTSPEDGLNFSPSSFDWGVDEELMPPSSSSVLPCEASPSFPRHRDIKQAFTPTMRPTSCLGKIEHPPMFRRNYPPLYCAQTPPATAQTHLDLVDEHQLSSPCSTANTNSSMSLLPWHGTNVAPHLRNAEHETTLLCCQILPHVVKEQQQLSASVAVSTASNVTSVNAVRPSLPRSNSACGPPSHSFFHVQQQQQQQQLDQKMRSQKKGSPQFRCQSSDYVPRLDTKSQPRCGFNTSGVESNIYQSISRSHPTRLSIPSDEQFLDPVHNFFRSLCIEVFVCGADYNSEGCGRGAKPNAIGQVGLRCAHCKHIHRSKRAKQSVSYPSKTAHIFESVRNYQRTHFEACEYIPSKLKEEYIELVSHTHRKIQLKYIKVYFDEAACEIGMMQAPHGLFFGAPPNTSGKPSRKLQAIMNIAENPYAFKHLHNVIFPKGDDRLENLKFSHIASAKTRQVIDNCRKEKAAFVYPSDFATLSDFRFVLLHQFVPCRPSKTKLKLGRRKTMPEKWETLSGLRCKHCAKAYLGATNHHGMYFPFDFDTLRDTSFFNNLAKHILTCQNVPPETKETLDELQRLAAEHGIITKRGAKSLFLKKLWDRMANCYAPRPIEDGTN